MRWLSFYEGDRARPGVLLPGGEGVVDLGREMAGIAPSWEKILLEGRFEEIDAASRRGSWRLRPIPLDGLRLAPPVGRPSKVIAIGRNYRAHAEEQGKEPPAAPLLFSKAPSCLLGHGGTIVLPPQEDQTDYEAELAVVIGRRASRLQPDQALDCLAGVTAMNDVSGRRAQFGDKQWFRGKSFDTFGPLGPWVVTLDEIPDLRALAIRCRVNGELRQEASTADMIHAVEDLAVYITAQMTLEPGDVISTGTPSGVGVFRNPPVFLRDGDVVEVEIDGVGTLRNPVAAP